VSDWRGATLGEVLTLQRGFDLPARARRDGPYPIVSSAGITGRHAVAKAKPPGVVIGRYGSLGLVHWVTDPYWPLNTALWVKDFKGNDPRFVSYLLQTLPVDGSSAAAVPGVNRNHLHTLAVRVPIVPVQRRISKALAMFDELVEINSRRIALLEELARSIYREWFVRFRFPGHADTPAEIDLQQYVPTGWHATTLGELAELVTDGVSPRDIDPRSPYCGLEHLPRRATTLRAWAAPDGVASRKLRFRTADTLFGKIRPYFHKVVWAPFCGVASSDTIVFRALPDCPVPALINAILSSDGLVAEAVATSNGTKMPRADARALLSYRLVLPDLSGELVQRAERTLRACYDDGAILASQNVALAHARDLLLPRLVSGRLDIRDVDLDNLPTGDRLA
jgi:type I restriction enzyme S subunit